MNTRNSANTIQSLVNSVQRSQLFSSVTSDIVRELSLSNFFGVGDVKVVDDAAGLTAKWKHSGDFYRCKGSRVFYRSYFEYFIESPTSHAHPLKAIGDVQNNTSAEESEKSWWKLFRSSATHLEPFFHTVAWPRETVGLFPWAEWCVNPSPDLAG